MDAIRRECPVCGKAVRVTRDDKLFRHNNEDGNLCDASSTKIHVVDISLPDDPFTTPPRPGSVSDVVPMTPLGAEIAARVKEMFHGYTRRTARTTQGHLGPSEVGSPCDRRLAMSLMRVPAVSPGGDNWASFVGTWVHLGLSEVFMWADAGSGRFAVELPLEFPSVLMPRGTGDLLDRVLCAFLDHKVMGKWSLDKLRTLGPSRTYRVQVHLYAFAARKSGENVTDVAIIGWPREGSSLDDLYVWTEPYDPRVAQEAMQRLERIGQQVEALGTMDPRQKARTFPASDDCRYCKFHAPGDTGHTRGCPGR